MRAAAADLRPPDTVMRLARMGAFHPTRLSFMRTLIRQLAAEGAQVSRPVWEIGPEGYGRAVYSAPLGGRVYSLVAFSTPLAPEDRTDRVIAEAWDTTYTLFDGMPETADLDRLERETPKQEAGRFTERELVLSRANKSVRLFAHVVDRLAEGRQPDPEMVESIGYLMRTTAVYGNGKFGIADRALIADRPEMRGPFRPEMLTVWLIREFTLDLAEHIAAARDPGAARLSPGIRRHLGIGNATGLGMAPFLVTHPTLLNNWMLARETALARVLAVEEATPAERDHFARVLDRAKAHVAAWSVEDARQMARIETLRGELAGLTPPAPGAHRPWAALMAAAAGTSDECQELLAAAMMEPYGHLVDGLADCMYAEAQPALTPGAHAADLAAALESHFGWALAVDFARPEETHQFWYVSEDKLEPRLGLRREEPGADLESPLDIARQMQVLAADLDKVAPEETVAAFLARRPEHRRAAKRALCAARYPYAEIRDNLIGAACLPIDMLRCKLSFFGASKFDPKSDRWTRVTMYQGAPTAADLSDPAADDWCFPVLAP